NKEAYDKEVTGSDWSGQFCTPLLGAVHLKKHEVARFLLQHKAGSNRPEPPYRTPLLEAAQQLHLETIQLLVESRADVRDPRVLVHVVKASSRDKSTLEKGLKVARFLIQH